MMMIGDETMMSLRTIPYVPFIPNNATNENEKKIDPETPKVPERGVRQQTTQ